MTPSEEQARFEKACATIAEEITGLRGLSGRAKFLEEKARNQADRINQLEREKAELKAVSSDNLIDAKIRIETLVRDNNQLLKSVSEKQEEINLIRKQLASPKEQVLADIKVGEQVFTVSWAVDGGNINTSYGFTRSPFGTSDFPVRRINESLFRVGRAYSYVVLGKDG